MEKWQKDFFEVMETVADEVDQFFHGVTDMMESFLEITEQVQNTIVTEIDQYLDDLAEPIFEIYWELEEVIGTEQPFPYPVEPTQQEHPACIGCCHYHGQVYNGNLLVCGMHPYGWEDESCPDWEQE
jgi:hypothetical protein